MQATLHHPALFNQPDTEPAHTAQAPQDGVPAVESQALLQGRKAVTIHHNGALYRLQATRLGKLILTK